MSRRPTTAAAATAVLLAAAAAAALAAEAPGEEARAGSGRGDGVAAGGVAVELARAKAPARARRLVRLPRLDAAPLRAEDALRTDRDRGGDKRWNRVGVVRPMRPAAVPPTPSLWGDRAEELGDGSRVFRVEVAAPGARGLRLRLRAASLPAGSELTLHDADEPAEAYGPLRPAKDAEGWLTPTVFGERAVLALRVPADRLDERVGLTVDGVAQLYRALDADEDRARAGEPRASSPLACIDPVACDPDVYATVSRGVARFTFESGGNLFLCTGTLLADLDAETQIPWMLTAHHCVSSDKSARSMEMFWDYKAPACNGSPPSILTVPRTVGATLVVTTPTTDCTLVRVTGALPSDRFFCGWTTTKPATGADVAGVHHPEGSHMRISKGDVTASTANFHTVRWREGVTAEGSSGSALFDAQQRVVGQLCCGSSFCTRPRDPDDYGRFDQSYARILEPYLGVESVPPTDAWDPSDDTAAGGTFLPDPPAAGLAHGPHSLVGADLQDWFLVDLTQGVAYEFEGTGATRGELHRDVTAAELVASDDGGPDGFAFVFVAPATGRYALRVARAEPGADTTYQLRITRQDAEPPVRVTALRATARRGVVVLTWRDRARDERGYRVDFLGPGGWIRVGELPANARRFTHRPGPGLHTYRVGPYDAVSTNWREIHVRVRGRPGLDAFDPADDTGAGATPLGVAHAGDTEPHELDKNDVGDWFLIDLVEGETWVFETRSDGDTVGAVYADPGGLTLVAEADDQQDPFTGAVSDRDFRLVVTAPATATYWILVRAYPSTPRATYTLHFELQ